jgi:hypothetical protein
MCFVIIALQLRSTIRHQEVPRKQGLEMNGTHQLVFCADGINLLGETLENTEALADISKERSKRREN